MIAMTKRLFIKGPIYLDEFCNYAKLKGAAPIVYMLIKHRINLTGKKVITLQKHLLTSCEISASVLSRTLDKMEEAGFIKTLRQKGHSTKIELLKDIKND